MQFPFTTISSLAQCITTMWFAAQFRAMCAKYLMSVLEAIHVPIEGALCNEMASGSWNANQPAAIYAKQRRAKQLGRSEHVEYMPLDLNEDSYPQLEDRLAQTRGRSLVLMEGVSPYVEKNAFCRFLSLLASMLPGGSLVAYDFKFDGVYDDFGRTGRMQNPFRLPRVSEEVAAFHAKHGHLLEHLETSSALTMRLLPSLAQGGANLFYEDALAQLTIKNRVS
jgi:hypothetical protein